MYKCKHGKCEAEDYRDASVSKRNRSSANNYNIEIHTILWGKMYMYLKIKSNRHPMKLMN